MNSLGSRMKFNYEDVSRIYLLKRTPVILRLDGKAFHTYTRNCKKPFDTHLMNVFGLAIKKIVEHMQGWKLAYHQSDEVSFLLTDFDSLETEPWFDYNKSKIESSTSSIFTAWFNFFANNCNLSNDLAFFDCRSFNIPKEEVTNYFVWRAKDWLRNSLQMYARSFFSHKQLHQKNSTDIHEMLHSIGKNWTIDLDDREKNGSFFQKNVNKDIEDLWGVQPTYESINNVVDKLINGNDVFTWINDELD